MIFDVHDISTIKHILTNQYAVGSDNALISIPYTPPSLALLPPSAKIAIATLPTSSTTPRGDSYANLVRVEWRNARPSGKHRSRKYDIDPPSHWRRPHTHERGSPPPSTLFELVRYEQAERREAVEHLTNVVGLRTLEVRCDILGRPLGG